MAESKEQEWIRTKKRTDRLVFLHRDATREGYGRVSTTKIQQEEAVLASVFDKFERVINREKRKPIMLKLPWTKDRAYFSQD